jgi:hypothetical protein
MVDIKNKTCEVDNCVVRAHYDVVGGKGRFCTEHKLENMINITNKVCKSDGCSKQPCFNFKGEKIGRFCVDHQMDNMVDVKNKMCETENCLIRAHFDFPEGTGKFCSTHKLLGMIDLTHNNCCSQGCNKKRIYNIKGQRPKFCLEHKSDDMIVVTYILCEIEDCTSNSMYGFLGKNKQFCKLHHTKGMIISPTKKCSTTNCRQLGTHEHASNRYCQEHALTDSINLGVATCSSCGLDDILTNGKCGLCDPVVIETRTKSKENRVANLLVEAGIRVIQDKMLEGTNCGRERPDFQIDCGDHFVYLEVDEHQHQSYACECEQIRMINLAEVRGIPVTFIRYNPDMYQPVSGQKYKSVEQREQTLLDWVVYAMKNNPFSNNCMANVLYLFYDEYDAHKPAWHELVSTM